MEHGTFRSLIRFISIFVVELDGPRMGEWMTLPSSEELLMRRIQRGVRIRCHDHKYIDEVVRGSKHETARNLQNSANYPIAPDSSEVPIPNLL